MLGVYVNDMFWAAVVIFGSGILIGLLIGFMVF